MSEMITVRNRALTRGRRCLSFHDGAIKDVDDGELLARGRFPPEMLATDRAQQTAQAKRAVRGSLCRELANAVQFETPPTVSRPFE